MQNRSLFIHLITGAYVVMAAGLMVFYCKYVDIKSSNHRLQQELESEEKERTKTEKKLLEQIALLGNRISGNKREIKASQAGLESSREMLSSGILSLEGRLNGTEQENNKRIYTLNQNIANLEQSKEPSPKQLKRILIDPVVKVDSLEEIGSAVVMYSDNRESYLLTAYHLIKANLEKYKKTKDKDFLKVNIEIPYKGVTSKAEIKEFDETLDLALLKLDIGQLRCVKLPSKKDLKEIEEFVKVYAVGCPLGYDPSVTSGEISLRKKMIGGQRFFMISAPTIFGNSGGAIYDAETGCIVGILSRIAAYKNLIDVAVPQMGLVTPMDVVCDWSEEKGYSFDQPFKKPIRIEASVKEPAMLAIEGGKKK